MVSVMKNFAKFLYLLLAFSIFPQKIYAAENNSFLCVKIHKNAQCEKQQTVQERIDSYLQLMAVGNPYAAEQFLEDTEAANFSKSLNIYQQLKAQAYALADLEKLLMLDWNDKNFNKLNKALTIRMTEKSILSESGIGPEPEKILSWIKLYFPDYGNDKISAAKKAIREWQIVFGNIERKEFTNKNHISQAMTMRKWLTYVLSKRNAFLNELMEYDPAFRIYMDFDEADLSVAISTSEIQNMVNKALKSGTLNAEQIHSLTDIDIRPEEQLSLLGKMFDGSSNVFNPVEITKINAQRRISGNYLIMPKDLSQISMMLSSSVMGELRGTEAGEKISEYGAVKIQIGTVNDAYSRLEKDGSITIDRNLIGQFLQMKGYAAESLVSGSRSKERLTELSKYISPLAVYEGMHRKQQKYSKANNIYKAHTQEDEIEASAAEAIYFAEKMKKDSSFYDIFFYAKDYSSYALKRYSNAGLYGIDENYFEYSVRENNSGTPTAASASAYIMAVIKSELPKRSGEKEDNRRFSYNSLMGASPKDIHNMIGEIRTDALIRLYSELADGSMFKYYEI